MRLRLVLVPVVCLTASLLSGCGNDKPAATSAEKPAVAPATEVRYECPMGCAGSKSTKPGKCPVCGMALEKKA